MVRGDAWCPRFWRRVGACALGVSLALVMGLGARQAHQPLRPRMQLSSSMVVGPGLAAVSCWSAKVCMAVGEQAPRHGARAVLAQRWDGRSWRIVDVPRPSRKGISWLNAVSCPSTRVCVAVGGVLRGDAFLPLSERSTGERWSILRTGSSSGGAGFYGVSCASVTTCVAVGWALDRASGLSVALAMRWNGRGWSVQDVPQPPGTRVSELLSVSCASSSACTAVGDTLPDFGNPTTLAERWDGSRWSIQHTPNPYGYAELEGVSCPSSTTCSAVGVGWRRDGSRTTVAERWNGSAWLTQRLPRLRRVLESGLNGVSCAPSGACTAVGWALSSTAIADAPPPVMRWNGARWLLQPTPAVHGGVELAGVSCPSGRTCIAVGIANLVQDVAERWNGTRWSIDPRAQSLPRYSSVFPGTRDRRVRNPGLLSFGRSSANDAFVRKS